MTVAVEVDVRDLVGRPGSARELRVDEPIEGGMAIELAAVPADRPVRADLLLESVVEGILASGSVSGEMDLSCARCLSSDRARLRGRGAASCSSNPSAPEPDEEYLLPSTGVIDIEPMLRDAVVLSMPFSPLCRPDCKGLCPSVRRRPQPRTSAAASRSATSAGTRCAGALEFPDEDAEPTEERATMATPKRRRRRPRAARGRPTGRRLRRPTASARSAISRSCRTACAPTAATTAGGRRRGRVGRPAGADAKADARWSRPWGPVPSDAGLCGTALTHRRTRSSNELPRHDERAPGVPGRRGARHRGHRHRVPRVPRPVRRGSWPSSARRPST